MLNFYEHYKIYLNQHFKVLESYKGKSIKMISHYDFSECVESKQ